MVVHVIFFFIVGMPKEYCSTDKFHATCDHGSVILMKTAQYGRMKAGRCITGSITIHVIRTSNILNGT